VTIVNLRTGAGTNGAWHVTAPVRDSRSSRRCPVPGELHQTHVVTVAEVVPQTRGASFVWRTREPYLCLGLAMPRPSDARPRGTTTRRRSSHHP
jgi:hypothetical protein